LEKFKQNSELYEKEADVPIDNRGGQIGGQIILIERQSEIIQLIKSNSKISRNQISEKLKINESAIQKHLNALKSKGVLKRVGGTRGYWEVMELGNRLKKFLS